MMSGNKDRAPASGDLTRLGSRRSSANEEAKKNYLTGKEQATTCQMYILPGSFPRSTMTLCTPPSVLNGEANNGGLEREVAKKRMRQDVNGEEALGERRLTR